MILHVLLSKLKWLDVSINKLTSVSPQMGNLTELFHLDLSWNQLTLDSLHKNFFTLKSLKRLYLSDNRLERISSDFGGLKV